MFEQQKRNAITKKDHSKKGCVDEEIVSLVDLVNSKDNMYTTSSCAGRIVLLQEPKSGKKKDFEWLYVSHSKANFIEIKKSLGDLSADTIWLKMEPFIIHICLKNIDDVNDFIDMLRDVGLKHSGIITMKKRIIVEVVGNEILEVPIAAHGQLLIDENYFEYLVGEANNKLLSSRKRLKMFENKLKFF
jgi:tRNA wybutosine-synthesizing protein 3